MCTQVTTTTHATSKHARSPNHVQLTFTRLDLQNRQMGTQYHNKPHGRRTTDAANDQRRTRRMANDERRTQQTANEANDDEERRTTNAANGERGERRTRRTMTKNDERQRNDERRTTNGHRGNRRWCSKQASSKRATWPNNRPQRKLTLSVCL